MLTKIISFVFSKNKKDFFFTWLSNVFTENKFLIKNCTFFWMLIPKTKDAQMESTKVTIIVTFLGWDPHIILVLLSCVGEGLLGLVSDTATWIHEVSSRRWLVWVTSAAGCWPRDPFPGGTLSDLGDDVSFELIVVPPTKIEFDNLFLMEINHLSLRPAPFYTQKRKLHNFSNKL